jgi:hypothetical protein
MKSNQRKSGAPTGVASDLARTPHKAFMKLAGLELEKARHLQERASVLLRLRNIEDRLRTIEFEQRTIQTMFPPPPAPEAIAAPTLVRAAAVPGPVPAVAAAAPVPVEPAPAPAPVRAGLRATARPTRFPPVAQSRGESAAGAEKFSYRY